MQSDAVFPALRARDLEGRDVELPNAFVGERNIVVVAFQRNHQDLVDSWVPWFEQRAPADPGLRFYELPTIGRIWVPVRRFIDGGMAAAIRDPVILQRTFTVYGDVTLVTAPLGIEDRSTITVLALDGRGVLLWRGTGACTTELARQLDDVLDTHRQQ